MHFIGLPSKPSLLTFSGQGNFFLCEGRRMYVMQLLQTLRQFVANARYAFDVNIS
jgi:hypothetical protein